MHLIYQLNRRLKKIRHTFSSALRGQIAILGLLFIILMAVHVLAMMLFEGLSLGDATWLTITTATTVGYGDISAGTTAGRLSTALLMYLGGIFILAQLAGLVFEATAEKREKRLYGKLPIRARGHIVIFGWREQYVTDVVAQIRRSIAPLNDADIIIVSNNMETLPNHLRQQGVKHVVGALFETDTFDRASLQYASTVVISPEKEDPAEDFATLDLIQRVFHHGVDAPVIAELNAKERMEHAKDMGASQVQLFNPNFPDMLARSVLAPGSARLVEEVIKDSQTEMLVLHLPIRQPAQQIRAATDGVATLLGVQSTDSDYQLHPADETMVQDAPLVFLIDTDRFGSTAKAKQALLQQLAPLTEDRTITSFRTPAKVGIIGATKRVSNYYLKSLQRELREETSVALITNDCWEGPSVDASTLADYNALVVLADNPTLPDSDAKTFATIHLLRHHLKYQGRIITEAVIPDNKERFSTAGANDVIRPVTRNLEILARCILTGAEEILDNLFNSDGYELLRIDITGKRTWQDIADRLVHLGLPLGYESKTLEVEVLPQPQDSCQFQAIFMLVDRAQHTQYSTLSKAVKRALGQ